MDVQPIIIEPVKPPSEWAEADKSALISETPAEITQTI